MLFFVVLWKEIYWDTDQFLQKGSIFYYIHGHGWSISGCPIIFLSSAIERRARGLSFPLLRMLIGQLQLPQRAGRSWKRWRNTTCSNPSLVLIIILRLLYTLFLGRYLFSMVGKGGKEYRKQWITISGMWWHAQLSYYDSDPTSVWISATICCNEGRRIFGVELRHGSFDSHTRL